jgi:transglutaminase-like putative cysteine protease
VNTPRLRWPSSTAVSLLAALSTWVSMWAWSGFAERSAGFLVPIMGGCLVVAASGALLRSARLNFLLVLLGQLVVVTLWLNHLWAADRSPAGWVPTPTSLQHLGSAIGAAGAAAQAYAAPVPASVPQFYPLMVVLGVGTALVVDFLACGLRRVPLAGLPLLAVYSVPVSILVSGVAWWKFAAGAMCFLFLLAADETQRLAHWGRQLSSSRVFDSQVTGVSTQALRASARKIGLTATGLAVVAPFLVPSITIGLIDGHGKGNGGNGDAVGISNPIVDLKRDLVRGRDRNVVWVTTPDPDPSYLRLSVLDSFDGNTWQPSTRDIPVEQRANGPMPTPLGLDPEVPRSKIPYSIRIGSDFASRWLPTPYPISDIQASGDWRYDTSTMDFITAVESQNSAGESYRLTALAIRPSAEHMAAAGPAASNVFRTYTALPDKMPTSVARLAERVTRNSPSRFEKAVRLQDWFRRDGGFTYSLSRAPSGNGFDQLTRFLGTGPDSRRGYCEQFAAAMAIMGRTLGIPSRVAVGFLTPTPVGGNTYVYSTHDLHAWPEMYFEGTGWVRFEPTPADRALAVPDYTSEAVPAPRPNQGPTSAPGNLPQGQNRIDRQTAPVNTAGPRARHTGLDRSDLTAGILAAIGLVALALAPRGSRVWVRRRRWARAASPGEIAEAAWSELRDTARDLRLPWDDSVTLRTRARGLVGSFGLPGAGRHGAPRTPARGAAANPEAAEALERLVVFVERARYARTVEAARDVPDDVSRCVHAMRAGASRRQRVLADWLPASLLAGLGDAGPRARAAAEASMAGQPGVDHAI